MVQAVTRIISKAKIRLDFGTFELYRIEVLEDLKRGKRVKIFYKTKDRSDRGEKTLTESTIYSDSAKEYADIAKDYHARYVNPYSSVTIATPRNLMAALLD